MTTPGSRAGHTGADSGSGAASGDQGGTRGPGRPGQGRGRHSADGAGGRRPDDRDDEDVYNGLYRREDQDRDDGRYYRDDDQYRDDDRYRSDQYPDERYGPPDRYPPPDHPPPDHPPPDRYREPRGHAQSYRQDDGYRQDNSYRQDNGYRQDDRYQGPAEDGRSRGDDVYDNLYRPEDRPRERDTERYERYRQDSSREGRGAGGYSQGGSYDETDLHPVPDGRPRRGTVRRYGAARLDSTDLFPAASQAGAGWIEPDFATSEIAAVEAGWSAGTDRWTVPVRRPQARGTQVLPRDERAGRPGAEPAGTSITRSSGVMAIGTMASRGTGLLRTLVQAYALGAAGLSVAYNNANTLPNVVYNLVIGGILTSVIVPLLVTAARRDRDRDRGEAYDQRMFTLVTVALLALTIVATLLAAPLVDIYKGSITGSELHLLIILAYFFIPQIFFYGVSSLAGAILNARGSFAAPMWTPVVNNVVVIVILLLFLVTSSTTKPTISSGEVGLLGVGTTLGIVAQTIALVPALRRVGFRWRPRTDFRRDEVSEIGRMGGWMFGYIATTQVAFLVTTNVANTVSGSLTHTASSYANYTAYTYGWQLFQMPYAVVGISVITALLPRMSLHASEGDLDRVRDDFSTGIRLSSAIVVPSSLVLAVLGPAIGEFLLAYHHTTAAAGRYEGLVFALFCLGLLPYMFFQLQLRVFYSLHDSRTPAIIGAASMVTNIAVNIIALHALPARDVVAGLGLGFGLANLVGAIIAGRILSVRLGGVDGSRVTQTLVRMHVATVPAAVFALAVSILFGTLFGTGHLGAFATVLVGGVGAVLLYMLFARALHVRELADLIRSVTSRFRR